MFFFKSELARIYSFCHIACRINGTSYRTIGIFKRYRVNSIMLDEIQMTKHYLFSYSFYTF